MGILLILIAAIALRAGFFWNYLHTHSTRALGTIPFLFEPGNIAFSIVSGNGFASPFRVDTGPTAWMTPVYPLLLAAAFRLFGTYTFSAYLAAATLNIFFSALTCIPIFFAAKYLANQRTAAIAALLWAIFPNAILLPYESLFEASLSGLLAATMLWATLKVAASNRTRDWCAYGLLWGLALMTNASLAALLPFLLAWAGRAHPRKSIVAAATIVLACLPWTIRNYSEFHTLVPLRTVGGLALWLGNNDHAGSLTPAGLHPISNQTERDKYIEQGEIVYMAGKESEAIGYILAHPGFTLERAAQRFVAIWTGTDFRTARTPRFYWVVAFNIVAALGALAGIAILWRNHSPYTLPLAVFPLVFPLVYYFALAPPRYRHPIDPILLILTAIAFTHLPNYWYRSPSTGK